MIRLNLTCIAIAMTCVSTTYAGGLLTNTNQNIAFNRNMARDGAIGIDGVYSNPAGVAFLSNGLHLSFNFQNVYQTRMIESSITVPSLKGSPYYTVVMRMALKNSKVRPPYLFCHLFRQH